MMLDDEYGKSSGVQQNDQHQSQPQNANLLTSVVVVVVVFEATIAFTTISLLRTTLLGFMLNRFVESASAEQSYSQERHYHDHFHLAYTIVLDTLVVVYNINQYKQLVSFLRQRFSSKTNSKQDYASTNYNSLLVLGDGPEIDQNEVTKDDSNRAILYQMLFVAMLTVLLTANSFSIMVSLVFLRMLHASGRLFTYVTSLNGILTCVDVVIAFSLLVPWMFHLILNVTAVVQQWQRKWSISL